MRPAAKKALVVSHDHQYIGGTGFSLVAGSLVLTRTGQLVWNSNGGPVVLGPG